MAYAVKESTISKLSSQCAEPSGQMLCKGLLSMKIVLKKSWVFTFFWAEMPDVSCVGL